MDHNPELFVTQGTDAQMKDFDPPTCISSQYPTVVLCPTDPMPQSET